MPSEPEYHEFSPDRLDEVVSTMAAMTQAHEGWINFEPSVHVEDVPPAGSGVFSLFSARGPAIPLATWTPPSAPKRGRTQPAMIGLQHGVAAKVKGRLVELGHPLPDGWLAVQDYAKKGLVVAVPPSADHAEVVRWLLRAAALLSAVPLTGWRMAVYGRPG